jgi:hypothetical protein
MGNMIDRELDAVKKIADALTPLGIDVVAINSVSSVDWKEPQRESSRTPPKTWRRVVAELTIHVPFAEDQESQENNGRHLEPPSRT